MKFVDIKKDLNKIIKTAYPNIPIYGNEVKEGYQTPSFFTSLVSFPETYTNKNYASGGFTYKIVYFQNKKDELDQLNVLDSLYAAFGLSVNIGERTLICKEKDFDYIGEKADILEISIKFEFMEDRETPPDEDLMDEIDVSIIKEEE